MVDAPVVEKPRPIVPRRVLYTSAHAILNSLGALEHVQSVPGGDEEEVYPLLLAGVWAFPRTFGEVVLGTYEAEIDCVEVLK